MATVESVQERVLHLRGQLKLIEEQFSMAEELLRAIRERDSLASEVC